MCSKMEGYRIRARAKNCHEVRRSKGAIWGLLKRQNETLSKQAGSVSACLRYGSFLNGELWGGQKETDCPRRADWKPDRTRRCASTDVAGGHRRRSLPLLSGGCFGGPYPRPRPSDEASYR